MQKFDWEAANIFYDKKNPKKRCENFVRCWSTEDEIVTLVKVNDYGYWGLVLLCSGANDRIFSRQKVELNVNSTWFLCLFYFYLMIMFRKIEYKEIHQFLFSQISIFVKNLRSLTVT